MDADLPRSSLEFLEDVRPGAGGQREGSAAFVGERASASSTKNDPRGVGVEGLPTIARKWRRARSPRKTVRRRPERSTTMRQLVEVSLVRLVEIQPRWLLGRPEGGVRTLRTFELTLSRALGPYRRTSLTASRVTMQTHPKKTATF